MNGLVMYAHSHSTLHKDAYLHQCIVIHSHKYATVENGHQMQVYVHAHMQVSTQYRSFTLRQQMCLSWMIILDLSI